VPQDDSTFYDKPVGYKGHAAPTPYLGGSAVILAFAVAIGVLAGDWTRTGPLLGGMFALWIVGTVDDRRNVSPLLRVGVEVDSQRSSSHSGTGGTSARDPQASR
jgi:UDP-N-acetylmuramyl pentapeptide phosphotransferase/UDP-N-acetylglucosamine-1-phosphate transferase